MPSQRLLPAVELEYVASAEIDLGAIEDVGPVLAGQRRSIAVIGGTLRGPSLNATVRDGGADWQIVTADGTAIIDTRYSAVTDAGEILLISTQGYRFGPPDVLARIAAGDSVHPSEYTFRVVAKLESGASALRWVNHTVFVATAAREQMRVKYDLYAVR